MLLEYNLVDKAVPSIRERLFNVLFPRVNQKIKSFSYVNLSGNHCFNIVDMRMTKEFQKQQGLVVDGVFGTKTLMKLELVESSKIVEVSTEDKVDDVQDNSWFIKDNEVNPIFLSNSYERATERLNRIFGKPKKHNMDLVSVTIPKYLDMVLAWNTNVPVTTINFHKKAAEPLEKALLKIVYEFSKEEMKTLGLNLYGGGYSYRNVRGSDKLSRHSWAICIDINSLGNPMGVNPSKTTLAKHPELALKFANIMLECKFKTLEHDLMHWMYCGD